jgi:hypothetical protein
MLKASLKRRVLRQDLLMKCHEFLSEVHSKVATVKDRLRNDRKNLPLGNSSIILSLERKCSFLPL